MITMNWIPIGLNWTILFKCLEMTIVIWRYINKTELNWIIINLCFYFSAGIPGLVFVVSSFLSIQFSFIYTAPNHNKCHLLTFQWYSPVQTNSSPIHCNHYPIISNWLNWKLVQFIHTSIFYTCFIQFRVVGGLEPVSAVIRREAWYTLDRSPVHHRAIQRQTRHATMHAHTHY